MQVDLRCSNSLNGTPPHALSLPMGKPAKVPVVRNAVEAAETGSQYPSVVSLVDVYAPKLTRHKNRLLRPFDDVIQNSHPRAVSDKDVAAILEFAATAPDPLLVHCLAGQSRSTAVALGIMVARGSSPEHAYDALVSVHPTERPFTPNLLVVARFDLALGSGGTLFEAVFSRLTE